MNVLGEEPEKPDCLLVFVVLYGVPVCGSRMWGEKVHFLCCSSSGRYPPQSGKYLSVSGEYAPTSGKYLSSSGEYPPTSGKYLSSSGEYPPTSGKYLSSSGEYPPTSGKYLSSSGEYSSTLEEQFFPQARSRQPSG